MLIFKGRNRVTSGFRLPDRPDHGGIDIVGDDDRNVRSVTGGKVSLVQRWDGVTRTGNSSQTYGNLVVVQDGDGLCYYAHLDSIAVGQGQTVKAGDKLGIMGNTGASFGAHTHFERRTLAKVRLDPAAFLGIPNAKGTYTEPAGKNGWVRELSGWYYHKDGVPLTNQWVKYGGWWYWLGPTGVMWKGYQLIDGKLYWLNEAEDKIHGIPEGACVITDENGVIQK